MAEVTAKLKYYRVTPRKVRLVAGLIRGKNVKNAIIQLNFLEKKSAPIIAKLLKSAISNAKHNYKIDAEKTDLYIKEIKVDEGPVLKRHRPAWRGTVKPFKRRSSHVTIVLEDRKLKVENSKAKK